MTYDIPATLAQAWGLRDIGFSAAHVAAATTVANQLCAGETRPELIFVGGELARGLGHVNSTVELCVVGAAQPEPGRVHDVDGTKVSVRMMCAQGSAQLLELASGYRATDRRSEQLAIEPERLDDLVRLVTGRALVAAPHWVEAFQAVSVDAVRQTLISRNALAFAGFAADAFDALHSGDLFTAISMSASALMTSAQAVLAAAGDLDTSAKFIFRRLARTSVTMPWCGRLWQLANCAFPADTLPTPTTVRSIVEDRLLVGNQLLTWCAVDGWDKQLTELAEPSPLADPVRADGPRRSAYFVPVRFADGWTLLGPGAGYQTTENVIRLWRRLVGQRPDDYTHELAGAEPDIAALSIVAVEAAVSALQRIGAVEAPPAWSDRANAGIQPAAMAGVSLAQLGPALAISRSARFN